MNSANFIGKILSEPELRYSNDGQLAIASCDFEFCYQSKEIEVGKMKLVAFGKLANELKQIKVDSRICVEGSLKINAYELPDGYKQKTPELNASKIFNLGGTDAAA